MRLAGSDPHTRAGLRIRSRFAADDRLVAFVRRGDPTAFEIVYERHVRELMSFCRYMLASQADAEDAVQSTFASAHRALLADDRPIDLRPWLFTIARNACLSILRSRRPVAEISETLPSGEDPVVRAEQREDVRQVLATLHELPEIQRTALVLTELHGFSQAETGLLLGVRPEQVKSYVYQARTNLISERDARSVDCRAIREELSAARGAELLKSRLRRHLRSCPDCRAYAAEIAQQRRQLSILLPLAPLLALKRRALNAMLGKAPGSGVSAGGLVAGGSETSATLELAASGGGASALMVKLLVGAALLGAGSGGATLVLGVPGTSATGVASAASARLLPKSRPAVSETPAHGGSKLLSPTDTAHGRTGAAPAVGGTRGNPPTVALPQPSDGTGGAGAADSVAANSAATTDPARPIDEGGREVVHGKSEEAHGEGGEVVHGKSEEAHGEGGEEVHGKSEEAHGEGGEEVHGKSEEAHGKGAEEVHGKSEEAAEMRGTSEEAHGRSSSE